MKQSLILGVLVLVAGCAAGPNRIQADPVSPDLYGAYACDELGQAMDRAAGRMLVLAERIPFFASDANPDVQEYAYYKGRYKAMEAASRAKMCITTA